MNEGVSNYAYSELNIPNIDSSTICLWYKAILTTDPDNYHTMLSVSVSGGK